MAGDSIDIIIPVFNKAVLTKNCLESIAVNSDSPYRLILIDNASDMETKRYLEEYAHSNKDCTLIRNDINVGWVKAVNQGIGISTNPYILIMNNDTVVKTGGWLSKLMAVAEIADDIGLINPRFDVKGVMARDEPYIEIDFCRGYCILIKRAVIERIGSLDEAYGLGYYDDDDLSVRAIRAGFRCVRANDIVVEHLRDSTFSTVFEYETRRKLHEKNKRLFYSKWGKRLKIVFIAASVLKREDLKHMLLLLARRQHIIYLWNLSSPIRLMHINVRERAFTRSFSTALFWFVLRLNAMKKKAKRFDLVLTDGPQFTAFLSKVHPMVHCVKIDDSVNDILGMVDKMTMV